MLCDNAGVLKRGFSEIKKCLYYSRFSILPATQNEDVIQYIRRLPPMQKLIMQNCYFHVVTEWLKFHAFAPFVSRVLPFNGTFQSSSSSSPTSYSSSPSSSKTSSSSSSSSSSTSS